MRYKLSPFGLGLPSYHAPIDSLFRSRAGFAELVATTRFAAIPRLLERTETQFSFMKSTGPSERRY